MRPDVRRVLDTLKTALRLLEITNREIESRMAWSHGYLSRIFAGTIGLRVEHVLAIAEIIGLAPAEFFDLAFPVFPQPPTAPADRLRDLLRSYQPAHRPVTAAVEPAALPAQELADLLQRALGEIRHPSGREGRSTG